MFTYLALVSPPVALALDVFARSLAEIGRADDEDLDALRPGLVASPRTGRDAHRVPFLELDDLVVDLHPPAPAQYHVHLLLLLVRVAVRKAIAGRDALVAQAGLLELERLCRQAERLRRPAAGTACRHRLRPDCGTCAARRRGRARSPPRPGRRRRSRRPCRSWRAPQRPPRPPTPRRAGRCPGRCRACR